MMRGLSFFLAISLIGAGYIPLLAGATAADPATPSPRSLEIKEVMRLTDESGAFTFNELRSIKGSPWGDFIVSGKDQLLHFNAQGQFQRNLLKLGEGPGEIKYLGGYDFDGSQIVIGSLMPAKLAIMNQSGHFEHELKIDGLKPFSIYFLSHGGKHYFLESNLDFQAMKTGENKRENQIIQVDSHGKLSRSELIFETREALIKNTTKDGTTISVNNITRLLRSFDGQKYLYISHEGRYGIVQIDLAAQKICKTFRRNYEPVKYRTPKIEDETDKKLEEIANYEFFNDIWALRCHGQDLLVVTSLIDAQKGVLIDRFNASGTLIESFFLKIPGIERPEDLERKALYFEGDFFWTTDIDEEDNPMVIKYRVDWK